MQSTVAGIPCRIKVEYVYVQTPIKRADNPDDYFGYTDIEFTVLDRKGYPAPWLERKMSEEDKIRIEQEILENV